MDSKSPDSIETAPTFWEIIWDAVLAEPIAVFVLIGGAIAWYVKQKKDQRQQDDEKQARDNETRIEIVDLIERANYLYDQITFGQRSIYRFEAFHMEKTSTPLDIEFRQMPEDRAMLQTEIKRLRHDLGKFNIDDPSHKNLVDAKKIVSTAERLAAVVEVSLRKIRAEFPKAGI